MKKSLILALSLVAMTISLSACQKTPEEKVADALKEMTNDKQVERMNKIGKEGDEYFDRLLGPSKSNSKNSTESKKATKAPDSAAK